MTLQLYILRQLVISVGFSLAGIALIVLPTTLIQAIHRLGTASLVAVFEYLPLVLIEVVPYLLPMAFLLGVVATYGRMAAERELVAVRMAGIHPVKLTAPALLLAAVLSFWTWHLLAEVSPSWKYRSRNYLRHQAVETFKNFGSGKTELEFGGSTLTADRAHGNVFEGVLLDYEKQGGGRTSVTAELAELRIEEEGGEEFLVIELVDVRTMGRGYQFFSRFPVIRRSLDELFPVQDKNRQHAKYMTSTEISTSLVQDELALEKRREFEFEIHRRGALAWTYLLFLLLGVPTGIALRSSTQLGAFSGAVGYAFLYYVLALQLGGALARGGVVPPLAAAWATNGLFLVVGVIYFRRALFR